MKELVAGEIVEAVAVRAPIDEVAVCDLGFPGVFADRFSFFMPYRVKGVRRREVREGFRQS
jgi:hypothetical protein